MATDSRRHTLIHHFLERSAERLPEKTALVHGDARLTYAEIDTMSGKLACALLEQGVERGDRVAIFMDNCVEAVVSLFAALKAGAAFIMINASMKAGNLEFILNNSRTKVLLSQGGRAGVVGRVRCPHLKAVIMTGHVNNGVSYMSYEDLLNASESRIVNPGCIDLDLASIVYTSGSTGVPKGVMLSHLNMVSAAHSITTYLDNREEDVIINVMPLSFDYGLYQILMGFKIGGTVVLEKSFAYPYQVLETMARERVTGFPGVPTIFALMLRMNDIEKHDLSSLRYITNTAAALPVGHIRKLQGLFPRAKLYSMYGLTECKRVSYLPPEQLDERPGSVGKGMPNEEVYIVDEEGRRVGPGVIGELVVRGSNVMLGYWESSEETNTCLKPGKYPGERVLHTGDLFRMDEDGYLYFIARKDDMIKCCGEKVSPREIERVLLDMDGIEEAAVIGVPDEILGEAIKAVVVTKKGATLTENEILKHCASHLENNKIPKYIEIRLTLPTTNNGKICVPELKNAEGNPAVKAGFQNDAIYRTQNTEQQLLHTMLSDWARKTPEKAFVVKGRRRVSYGEVGRGVRQLAAFLIRSGLRLGDRVGILSENSAEYIISYFGTQQAGGIAVDINFQNSAHEIRKIINHCRAAVLIADRKYINAVQEAVMETPSLTTVIGIGNHLPGAPSPLTKGDKMPSHFMFTTLESVINEGDGECLFPELRSSDIASIVYTSGTTGEPKGVMLSHGNYLANARSIVDYLRLSAQDKVMVVLPFCYSYGKSLLTTHLMAGGTLILENSFTFPPLVFNKMVEEGVTGFAGVPSTFAIMLNKSNVRNYRFPGLRYVTQAGGPMPPRHAQELARVLPDADIYIMYGQTEATARLTYLEPGDLFSRPGSVGRPIPGVRIELIKEGGIPAAHGEEGEIVVTGENVMAGYFNDPVATMKILREGKLHTGDLGRMDEDGYLYLVGRRSDMIKSGAHRISPKEIEEVILGMDEVHEAAVVGIADEILGEVIRAVVVPKDGVNLEAKHVQLYCSKKLAAFKIPKEVVFADRLPKTQSGKVRKYKLKDNNEVKSL
jgi:amino acid adenylation domain-containing protein